MEEPHLLIERRGHVLIVTMNPPEVRNALSGPMMALSGRRGRRSMATRNPRVRADRGGRRVCAAPTSRR